MQDGTKVKLATTFYGSDDKYNPRNTKGVVVGRNKRQRFNPIIVEWDNGLRNSYEVSQLEIIKK